MRILNFIIALALFSFALTARAERPNPQGGTWRFLAPGVTHANESPLQPGKGWLALRSGKNGWELVETEVKATKISSEITDYDIEIKSSHKDAIALFRLPRLLPGPVATPIVPKGLLDTGFTKERERYPSFEVRFNSATYQFKGARGKVTVGNDTFSYDAVVVETENRSSNLGDSGGDSTETDSSDNGIKVVWIGDLDRDRKLDLITAVRGTNTSGLCLYLSSEAKGKEVFGTKICHEGSGC
jgi:hypothetical protein